MKLSISNIAWVAEDDTAVYELMKKYSFSGLEIAPTRIFPDMPYDRNDEAREWSTNLRKNYGFQVSSMQSIWYGRQEKLFGCDEERQILKEYTQKAIDFATVIGCKNLVFGCPKNRFFPCGADTDIGIRFFKEIGDYAYQNGTVIGIEANPTIYNTNYINDTISAIELIEQVESKGLLLNLDLGTMLYNKESLKVLRGKEMYINHVHISEPGLKKIEERALHMQLSEMLEKTGYQGFVSIEMGNVNDLCVIEDKLAYVKGIFK